MVRCTCGNSKFKMQFQLDPFLSMLCADVEQFTSRSVKIVSANQMHVLLQTPEIADDSAAGTEQTFSLTNALEF